MDTPVPSYLSWLYDGSSLKIRFELGYAAGSAGSRVTAKPSAVGTPINPNNLARGYLRLVQKAGVPRIRIHDTRHTHVTLAVLAGAQLGAVSKRVGHARTSTTADLYAHVLPEMHAEVAARINTVLFSSPLTAYPKSISYGKVTGGNDRMPLLRPCS